MDPKIDSTIISAVMNRIATQLSKLNEQRLRNRQISLIVGGAIIGFAIKESDKWNVVAMCFAAVAATMVFWYEDYRLHRYQHS